MFKIHELLTPLQLNKVYNKVYKTKLAVSDFNNVKTVLLNYFTLDMLGLLDIKHDFKTPITKLKTITEPKHLFFLYSVSH